jgi:hypothetical protein
MNFSTKNQTRGVLYVRAFISYGSVYTVWSVSPKDKTAFRLEQGLLDALREIRAKEGIPVMTQIEFAIRDWLKKKGATLRGQSKRAGTRKRS